MKRMVFGVIAFILILSSFSLTAFAENAENYDAVISAPSFVAVDDVVSVVVSVRNIKLEQGLFSDGLFGTAFTLFFDPTVFEAVNYTAIIPEKWEHFDRSVDLAEGKWTVFTAWDDGDLVGIKADDAIVVTYNLKVIGAPSDGETVLKIGDVQGSNGSIKLFYGTGSQTTVLLPAFAPKPGSLLKPVKENNTIVCATDNVKSSEFVKLFRCDPDSLTVMKDGAAISPSVLVSTGMTVTDGTDSYTVIVKGDADLDGKVTSNDYAVVKAHFKTAAKLTGFALSAADTDENGFITTADYLMIRRRVAGTFSFKI